MNLPRNFGKTQITVIVTADFVYRLKMVALT